MDENPVANHDVTRSKFLSIGNTRELCEFLEINPKHLIRILYKKKSPNYRTFQLRKKMGDYRHISSPSHTLKSLQRRINATLQDIIVPLPCAHGFLKTKNILTNAIPHVRKEYILNLDLKDFFPSINFGRVRGMFMRPPFSFSAPVATVLAQTCCDNNCLPQGAPTSPIISNIICWRLDKQLQYLANKYRCIYTRYADDISFSTTLKQFPTEIAYRQNDKKIIAGEELTIIINGNGFEINNDKVRLQHRTKRQEVTGVVVNKFPNVPRKLVRQIRAMLHAWEKFGVDAAQTEYHSRYLKLNTRKLPSYKKVVKGKLDFLQMVCGKENDNYKKFFNKYSKLLGQTYPRYFIKPEDEIYSALWILECEKDILQGTAFALENVGLVTCNHVIGQTTHAFRHDNLSEKYPIRIKFSDKDIDLAILEIDYKHPHFLRSSMEPQQRGAEIRVAGFPNYRKYDTPSIFEGRIINYRKFHGIDRILVDAKIVTGNSGGPVLNKQNKVIGVAVTGADSIENNYETENVGVIPISAIRHLLEK